MIKVEHRINSLRSINIVFLIISVLFLTLYNFVYYEDLVFYKKTIGFIAIGFIIGVLIISFIKKYQIYYQMILYALMWLISILTIYDLNLLIHFRLSLLNNLMLMVCVFAIFNKRTMIRFVIFYFLVVSPLFWVPYIPYDFRIGNAITIIVILFLGYMKSSYEYNISNAYSKSVEVNELIIANANEAFALHKMIYDNKGNPIDYQFLNVNASFGKMTGKSKNEIIGKSVLEMWPHTERYWIEFYEEVVTKKEQKQTIHYAAELAKYYDVSAYPVEGDQFAVFFMDVTETVQRERMLKNAIERSETADELKTKFLRDVNHRLRTPLNGMMGMLQLIDTGQMDKENQELFDMMLHEMKNSRNIINQIAKYVDIQGMKFEFTKCKLNNIINEEISKYSEDGFEIIVNMSNKCNHEEVFIEQNVFTQVFRELLSNAIKHRHDKNVEVDITCDNLEAEGKYLYYIKITDYGEGISKENLDFLFNEFFHHDFINIYREEYKISVPMCKQMLLGSGGNLQVESKMGVGSEFTMVLPVHI